MQQSRTGVTLLELVVVVGIIVLLLGLVLPAVVSTRNYARRLTCANNLRQIGIAVAGFHSQRKYVPNSNRCYFDLAPFFEFVNLEASGTAPSLLVCPADQALEPRRINYFLNHGSAIGPRNGVADYNYNASRKLSFSDFSDGLSNTAIFSERNQLDLASDDRCFWKTSGKSFGRGEEMELRQNLNLQLLDKTLLKTANYLHISDQFIENYFFYDHLWAPNRPIVYGIVEDSYDLVIPPSSCHAGSVHVLFADGSVRLVTEQVDSTIWKAMGSRNGADIVGFD